LANSVFGSADAMVRLDMSEFMERQSVSKLIGSPPGYVGYGEGGQLTEAVRRNPYTIILLDEIEKAHPDVFNLLLQVLEDGRLTDSQGRVVNFQNTLIIMTSNLGAQVIQKPTGSLGFNLLEVEEQEAEYLSLQAQVNVALKLFFRPEFLNRLDEVIVFQPLQRDEIKQIAEVMLRSLAERLSEQNIALEVSAAVKDQLAVEGYDPSFGARPLRRTISRLVEDTLAEAILVGTLQSGDTAVVDRNDDGQIHVYAKPVAVMAQVC
jgi:ATP-dependent Clp protease ATP-binding subunit ClpC